MHALVVTDLKILQAKFHCKSLITMEDTTDCKLQSGHFRDKMIGILYIHTCEKLSTGVTESET